ncbi:uncharacterized protein LOC106658134 [Trichogramma pretiosum]|uniref:uncharacterized protein LOC106658134 n=1 Tax=Trichogramma pretiosum TaxID=7493 RepID=UPI0006C997E8|nr:uncharacterized protein LOC106658134 [Trichogramma pretiosum]
MKAITRLGVHMLLLACLLLSSVRAQCGPASSDLQNRQNKLAIYKITLKTFWSRSRFPRHFPEWRPPAQFSKLVGRTHSPSFVLYRLGERLAPGARQFVETGRTDGLDGDGTTPTTYGSVLHSFAGPAIGQGEGQSSARAFLDANHTLVSLFARMNPSPDWFIGLDSFQLCVAGNWIDSVTVELDPLDGGTDNGFTFTAANWPTQPQGTAYRITSHFPAHPAGSFYYPNLPRLPPIAMLTFMKLREYTLTETYYDDDVEMEFVSGRHGNQASIENQVPSRGIDQNRDLNEAISEERREANNQRFRYWTVSNGVEQYTKKRKNWEKSTNGDNDSGKSAIINSIVSSYANFPRQNPATSSYFQAMPATNATTSTTSTTTTTTARTTTSRYSTPPSSKYQQQLLLQSPTLYDVKSSWLNYKLYNNSRKAHLYNQMIQQKLGLNSRGTTAAAVSWKNVTEDDTSKQQQQHRQHKFHKDHRHRLHPKRKRPRKRIPRDCKVSEWGAWSACSRSCGVGETQRTRRVLVQPRRGSRPCPPLKETKWCGSVKPCQSSSGETAAPHEFDDAAAYDW